MVITEAWAKLWHAAKAIRERWEDGFLAASKGAERDKPTKKHRLAFVFHFQKPLGMR